MNINLTDRLVLVTGTSRGIGYYTALEFSKAGAHVIACARTASSLKKLNNAIRKLGKKVELATFDLADMEAIDALRPYINERWGKLDVLVANAGILGPISPLAEIRAKSFEDVMTINVTATWHLIRALDPLLKASDCGRAIILSSGAAHKCRPLWGPYSASKAAVEVLARTWAKETENTSLRIISLDPGPTRTAMRAQAMPEEDPTTVPHPSKVAATIVSLVSSPLTTTGKLFSVRQGRFVDYCLPT